MSAGALLAGAAAAAERVRGGAAALVCALALVAAAGCASEPEKPLPRQPYKVVLLPVEGAAAALRAPAPEAEAEEEGQMVPLSLTPEELEKVIFEGVRDSNAFTEIVVAPASVRAAGGAFAGDEMAAAADYAIRSNADLILRVTVKSARVRDLGNNSSTFWSTFTWFMVPLPVWFVDDRTYDTNLAVEAALYEPRDVVKPTATVVAASGRHDLDLWDRGLSWYVPVVPPAFLEGNPKTVSEEVTRRAVQQLMTALSQELRTREIPARFDVALTPTAAGLDIVVSTRRQLRSLEVFVGNGRVQSWAETDLLPEPGATDERRTYRRSVTLAAATGAETEVRVIAEDEAGGREVRTLVVGGAKK